jgi:3-(3-hydroxy-phenyl)propionate hydroxylase
LAAYSHVQIRFEHELMQFAQTADGVELQVQHQGAMQAVRCRWLVGCDGGRSTVRQQLGIEWEGSTYEQRWLIADLIGRTSPFRHTRTYCDPQRPAIRLPGPQSTVRYEFMLKPGETPESVLPDSQVRAMIAQREPSDVNLTILRKVVYTFHARIARQWRMGRALIAGDAAHLTPPFAGQGMNSGVRDASNLAWKLAAVVHGHAHERLLDTYAQERAPHAWSLIQMALRIGIYMQPQSIWGAALAQGLLRMVCWVPRFRDHILHLKFKPKPRFFQGFLDDTPRPGALIPAGQLLPQPQLEGFDGQRRWLDDAMGPSWAVLRWCNGPALPALNLPGLVVIDLLRAEEDFLSSPEANQTVLRDVQGVLQKVMDSAQASAVLVRPDRYVLAYLDGTTQSATRLQSLLHAQGMDSQTLKA